jgi:hypothetical protein
MPIPEISTVQSAVGWLRRRPACAATEVVSGYLIDWLIRPSDSISFGAGGEEGGASEWHGADAADFIGGQLC